MSLSMWTSAVTLVNRTLSAVFGYIVDVMGFALPTFIHLAFLLAFTRLIIRPIVGMAISDILANGIKRRGEKNDRKTSVNAENSKK